MDESKITELLINLTSQMSAMQSDIKSMKEDLIQNTTSNEEKSQLIKEFIEERTRYAAQRQDSIKAQLEGKIELLIAENKTLKEDIKKNKESWAALKTNIDDIAGQDSKKLSTRWEQIKDTLFKCGLTFIGTAIVFYFFNLINKAGTQ